MRKCLSMTSSVSTTDDDGIETKLLKYAANPCFSLAFLLSIFYAVFGGILSQSPYYALVSLGLAIVYSGCLGLNALSLFGSARILFLLAINAHFIFLNVLVGPWQGAEYTALFIFILPALMFAQGEIRSLALSLATCAIGTIVGIWLGRMYGPLLEFSRQDYEIGYYANGFFIVLLIVAIVRMLHARMLGSYQKSEVEREKLASFLRDSMPAPVLAQVMKSDTKVADSHSDTAVLFADIVGFTQLMHRVSPALLLEFLDELFTAFDALAEEHGVEKIKTIGDSYMAATGVASAHDAGVDNLFEFALSMIYMLRTVSQRYGFDARMRIGVSSGHAISGVIGATKKTFDIWGDTVNLASRLEAAADPGKILVSEPTYWRLRERWHFDAHDAIELKGLGTVATYSHDPHDGPDNTVDFTKIRRER